MSKKKQVSIHPVDSYVGKRLRDRRSELKISQEQLAKHVTLTFQQIQKYEKGLNRISCSKLYDFSKFLKTDISYFFRGLENVYSPYYDAIKRVEDSGFAFAADAANSSYSAEGSVEGGNEFDIKNDIEHLVSSFSSIKSKEVRKNIINFISILSINN